MDTKICSKCGRELPIDRFRENGGAWCKNCCSIYTSEARGNIITEENAVKIERLFKDPFPQGILNTSTADTELVATDEYFVRLINYKNAWISNYGRPLEYNTS